MIYNKNYWEDVGLVIKNIPNIENLYGKKVLISGSTGMICSSVVDIISYLNCFRDANILMTLANRNEKSIVKRFSNTGLDISYSFIKYDATQIVELDGDFDYIIHGAGSASPDFFQEYPIETIKNNVFGIYSFLNLLKRNNKGRLLYLSSSEIYGNRINNSSLPFKENEYGYIDILNPRSSYPNGKRVAETICASFLKEYGTDFIVARPGHIYGPSFLPSDKKVSSQFTQQVIKGRNIVLKSSGNQVRSYCYTLDCASAILSLIINGKTGEAYNISNKNSIASIYELAKEFANCVNVKVVFQNPSDEERTAFNPMLNSSLDSTKLERLGWKGLFDLKTGVRRTIMFSK